MTRTSGEILLSLVRISLGNQESFGYEGDICWPEVMKMSVLHGVEGLLCDALQTLPDDRRPQSADLLKLLRRVTFDEQSYLRHKKAIDELASFYHKHDIKMMLVKGYGLSLNWPRPDHRPVGDMDIYLFGKWKEADKLVSDELGLKVNSGHEHHTVFYYGKTMVENHYDFINTKAHKDAPLIEARLKELALASPESEGVFYPTPYFNAIFLIRHLGQHFAGEKMTLKQIIDWGLFVRMHSAETPWDEVLPFLSSVGLLRFFHQVNAICVDYLGIAEQCFPQIVREDELERRIISDVISPEFDEKKPSSGFIRIMIFKIRRWWSNRWKHKLVYNEKLLPMFLTLLWSHLRRINTIEA